MSRTMRFFVTHVAIAAFCCQVTMADDLIDELQSPLAETEVAESAELEADDTGEIVLSPSGEMAGRIRVVWPTGKIQPANAEVAILSEGETLGTAKTDERGHFLLTGLSPGTYVARTTIPEGAKDFELTLLESQATALPSDMFFDATLTPLPDMVDGVLLEDTCGACGTCDECLATEIVAEEVIVDEMCCEMPCQMGAPCASSCGFSGGGGCCGGPGLGLLGLAGLAGLAGLTGGNDTSPFNP